MKKLLLALLAALSFSAHALDSHAGIPTQPYVAQATNYAYRITFEGIGGSAMCSIGGVQTAYVNKADDNYDTYVRRIEMAMVLRQTLTFYMAPTGGQCHIIEIQTS